MGRIHIAGLGKAFKTYNSRWGRLIEWLLPFVPSRYQRHWVLRDINLDIQAGEAVALVGMNGAGKSTLLKLIAGTLHPTEGRISTQGSFAALLELGIGFHPDFTGRQNVFMSGQLLGLTPAEIQALMPQIESFAEIGAYIDQPVRVYSSGMQVRLAFSLATARRPDILIIDEALSVGDAHFQHKSFERIKKYRALGTTLLIVSHDKDAIQTICDRVVLLDGGRQVQDGSPEHMFDLYNALIAEADAQTVQQATAKDGGVIISSGTGEARVAAIRIVNRLTGLPVQVVNTGALVCLEIIADIIAPIPCLVLGFSIRNRLGQIMYGTNTFHTGQMLYELTPGEQRAFQIEMHLNLGPGAYSISTALVSSDTHLDRNYEWRDHALSFEMVHGQEPYFEGQVYLSPIIEIH